MAKSNRRRHKLYDVVLLKKFKMLDKSAIHTKPYCPTNKLNYLYDSLRGDALSAVRGYDKVPVS